MDTEAKVRPLLEPDAGEMLGHLEHLFGESVTGRIELAWTDAGDGRLRHAVTFDVGELAELVERAFLENRVPGQSCYVGAALRRPDAPAAGRCGDSDFYALPAHYVDLDAPAALETARERYRQAGCPPTAAIITGRHPFIRGQLYWRLEVPERDADLCRRQNAALARALGGDPTVVNPGRVLRLGGSVAWPRKPGRIVELTEFHLFNGDDRPRVYFDGQLPRAFPPTAERVEAEPAAGLNLASGVSVADCLAAARRGDGWHNAMLALTAHWIGRGWSDMEILAVAESVTLAGWTADQTRREVMQMISGGRAKWNTPDPQHALEEPPATAPLAPRILQELNVAMLPRRQWLLGRTLLRRKVTVQVAAPGTGKSTLAMARAVAVVTGRELTGEAVHERVPVWIYNCEDDLDDLHRQLAAVLQHWEIPFTEVKDRLALNSGADRPLLVARKDAKGNILQLPDVAACIGHIRDHGFGMFVVDPFCETHEADENANDQIKVVAGMYRTIAQQADCAVLLKHHTVKPPQGSSDGHAGNMHTARGASALIGVARVVETLFTMSPKDAERLQVPEEERRLFVRLDDARANPTLISGEPRWFRRRGVTIANGDEVGVLTPEELTPPEIDPDDTLHRTIIGVLLARVPEPEITLNAAARLLAWCGDERFARYRRTDTKGHQRVNESLRRAIVAAARRNVCVVSSGFSRGFTLDEQATPAVLRRFEHPACVAEIGGQPPDFPEDDE